MKIFEDDIFFAVNKNVLEDGYWPKRACSVHVTRTVFDANQTLKSFHWRLQTAFWRLSITCKANLRRASKPSSVCTCLSLNKRDWLWHVLLHTIFLFVAGAVWKKPLKEKYHFSCIFLFNKSIIQSQQRCALLVFEFKPPAWLFTPVNEICLFFLPFKFFFWGWGVSKSIDFSAPCHTFPFLL